MLSNTFWKYFIAEVITFLGVHCAFAANEQPMPEWLFILLITVFSILYMFDKESH